MLKRHISLLAILVLLLSSCGLRKQDAEYPVLDSIQKIAKEPYRINKTKIREYISTMQDTVHDFLISGAFVQTYYKNPKNAFLWLNPDFFAADTLFDYLRQLPSHGIEQTLFPIQDMENTIAKLNHFFLSDDDDINRLLAQTEYQLTKSYLDYCCLIAYGCIAPHETLNNLENEEHVPGKPVPKKPDGTLKKKVFYEIGLRKYDTHFVNAALAATQGQINVFLDSIQPKDAHYLRLQEEYKRIQNDTVDNPDTCAINHPVSYYKDRVRMNMERLRWKTTREKKNKYISVNLPAFMLQAIDNEQDSVLEMKICCGTLRNRTPILDSRVTYMDLNPFWNVPQSIIRKEIIPLYQKDSTYFTRHRMRVYNKYGEELNPHHINWSQYKGNVPFEIKQDKGQGNSLGRLIFRFPNNHAVYLHDTPAKSAFRKTNRAVSHGCVRIEKPLEFSFFLLKEKDDLTKDKIRMAIGLSPQSEDGKKYRRRESYKEIEKLIFKEPVPLFLDYYTTYLSKDGDLIYCEDIYKYDELLLPLLDKKLNCRDNRDSSKQK